MVAKVNDPCPAKCTEGYFVDANNPDKLRRCGVCRGAGTIFHPLDDDLKYPKNEKHNKH